MNLRIFGFVCDCTACKLDLDETKLKEFHKDVIFQSSIDTYEALKKSVKKMTEQLKKNWMYVSQHHKNFESHSVPQLILLNKTIIWEIGRAASYPKIANSN